jgi:type IV fimbrial biogenesis protein FimT
MTSWYHKHTAGELGSRPCKQRSRGVTLIEMMVTLAVAAILLAAAVPSFTSLIQNNRAATQVNEFVTAVHAARGEAIKRGMPVTLCASNNQQQCNAGSSWSSGWVVFEDQAASGAPAAPSSASDDRMIKVWYALEGQSSLTGDVGYLRFLPNGTANWSSNPGATRTFTLDIPKCTGDQKREISVNRLGHVATKRLSCA